MYSVPAPERIGNDPPSEEDLPRIRQSLSAHLQELLEVDNQLSALTTRRTQLQACVDTETALLAPAIRLPPDVLREIFVSCLPATHNAVMSAREAPLLLGRVCSLWREVAWTSPQLWTSLHIPLLFVMDRIRRAERLAAVEAWLRRSGVLPLSVSYTRPAQSFWTALEMGLEGILFDWLHRMSHLQLINPSASTLEKMKTPSMLRALRVSGATSFLATNLLWAAPYLQDIALEFGRQSYTASHASAFGRGVLERPVKWLQLTSLSLQNHIHFSTVETLLHRCPQLQLFVIRALAARAQHPHIPEHFTHPVLQSFIILDSASMPGNEITSFLEHTALPELRCLRIPTTDADDIHVSFGTAYPHLEDLSLSAESFMPESLANALRGLVFLKKLDVRRHSGPWPWTMKQVLQLFAPMSDSAPILYPSLQEFTSDSSAPLSQVQRLLHRFIGMRIGTLRILRIRRAGNNAVSDWERWTASKTEFEQYKGSGLQFILLDPVDGSDEVENSGLGGKDSPWTGLEDVQTNWMIS
ncbi:hypothetical protein C8F01DRAFT_1180565 [Mycena amicta]|nr:hypothetical protein C8F01DRAFT_1180565 [Mycena amicta]